MIEGATRETYLKHNDSYNLDGKILLEELKVIQKILNIESKSSFMVYIKIIWTHLIVFIMLA